MIRSRNQLKLIKKMINIIKLRFYELRVIKIFLMNANHEIVFRKVFYMCRDFRQNSMLIQDSKFQEHIMASDSHFLK